ncbi:MAG: hypothetical protein RLY31_1568 [Bacteroidota bacterium]
MSDIQASISRGETSCRRLAEHYLQRIAATEHLRIYVEVFTDELLERADQLDARFRQDPAGMGPLFGAVVSIKDVICYEGHGVTAGSKILEGFRSVFSATAVQRLQAADAMIIGRVNCDEFAMGSTNETSVYGPTRNADDPSRVPGGSSGGSAVSVQADTCLVSLGSDTGGSVRQPAAFCGVVGFKPSYGTISRYGLLAYASSFDQIGILAKQVEDVEKVLRVVAGPDGLDATARPEPFLPAPFPPADARPLKIACFEKALHHPGMDADIHAHTMRYVRRLQDEGHQVTFLDFDLLDYLIPAYYVLTTAEASSNLSRYDGVRFGHRSPQAATVQEVFRKSRTEGFGPEVKRRILLGTFVLSSGYYDAYFTKAQQVRRLIRDATRAVFRDHDLLLMPASPVKAWKIGAVADDPLSMYLADIYTVQANMAGIPAVAIPIGRDADGMAVGVQFMADVRQDAQLLSRVRLLPTQP